MNGDLQFSQFLEELSYAYQNVPFYRKHFDSASEVIVEDIMSSADVPLIPTTSKRDYRKNFPMGVFATGFDMNDAQLTRSQSSGTTGERLVSYELGALLMGRAMACCEANPEVAEAFVKSDRKICRYAAPNCSDVECANPNSQIADRLLSDGTLVLPVYHDLLTTSEKLIERAISEIMDYQPDLYYVDPTHFAFLMMEFKKRDLSPPDAPILCSYTSINPLNEMQILERFAPGKQLVELYSCSEMGWLGMSDPQGRLHLNHTSYFFEILDENGEQVEPGQTGELVISSIDKGALPHLRYRTGDILRLEEGRTEHNGLGPVVSMMGRQSNLLTLTNGRKLPYGEFKNLIAAPEAVNFFQLHQHSLDHFTLKLAVTDSFGAPQYSAVEKTVRALLGQHVRIDIQASNYVATERSGKFQCFKSDMD